MDSSSLRILHSACLPQSLPHACILWRSPAPSGHAPQAPNFRLVGKRAVLGIEPRTSRTRSENHATRPNSLLHYAGEHANKAIADSAVCRGCSGYTEVLGLRWIYEAVIPGIWESRLSGACRIGIQGRRPESRTNMEKFPPVAITGQVRCPSKGRNHRRRLCSSMPHLPRRRVGQQQTCIRMGQTAISAPILEFT